MNLPNKITIFRIFLSICTLLLLLIPWYQLGIIFPTFLVAGRVVVDAKYMIAGVLFAIASFTDFLDGYIARSQNQVTDFGKVMDAIADKILVNGVLIIFAYQGFLSVVVPVIIITRDTIVDAIKMASGNKGKVVAASITGKIKSICMMIGLTFMFFYNIPFELVRIPFTSILILVACVLSIVSGCQYYFHAKEFLFKEK